MIDSDKLKQAAKESVLTHEDTTGILMICVSLSIILIILITFFAIQIITDNNGHDAVVQTNRRAAQYAIEYQKAQEVEKATLLKLRARVQTEYVKYKRFLEELNMDSLCADDCTDFLSGIGLLKEADLLRQYVLVEPQITARLQGRLSGTQTSSVGGLMIFGIGALAGGGKSNIRGSVDQIDILQFALSFDEVNYYPTRCPLYTKVRFVCIPDSRKETGWFVYDIKKVDRKINIRNCLSYTTQMVVEVHTDTLQRIFAERI